MAESKAPESITPVSFFSVVSGIYVSMFLVLIAATKSESDWFHIFVMIYLVVMQLFYLGAMIWYLSQRKKGTTSNTIAGSGPVDERLK